MVEVLNAPLAENAFGRFQMELSLLQGPENAFQMIDVGLEIMTVNQYVIEEDKHEFAYEWTKELIHCGLENGWRIAKAKWHHDVFVVALVCSESGLGNVVLLHANLMEALREVHFQEPRGIAQIIKELIYGW